MSCGPTGGESSHTGPAVRERQEPEAFRRGRKPAERLEFSAAANRGSCSLRLAGGHRQTRTEDCWMALSPLRAAASFPMRLVHASLRAGQHGCHEAVGACGARARPPSCVGEQPPRGCTGCSEGDKAPAQWPRILRHAAPADRAEQRFTSVSAGPHRHRWRAHRAPSAGRFPPRLTCQTSTVSGGDVRRHQGDVVPEGVELSHTRN